MRLEIEEMKCYYRIYMYVYTCVCVCVCNVEKRRRGSQVDRADGGHYSPRGQRKFLFMRSHSRGKRSSCGIEGATCRGPRNDC